MFGLQLLGDASRLHLRSRFPAITVEDIEAFCKYTESVFHEHGGQGRDMGNIPPTLKFRMRGGIPAGITEVAYASVLEWKEAKAAVGEHVVSSGCYRHVEFGEVVTLGLAKRSPNGTNPEPVLIFIAGEEMLYADPNRFFGATFIPQGARWEPTAVFLGMADDSAADEVLASTTDAVAEGWFDVRAFTSQEVFEVQKQPDGGLDGFRTLPEAIEHANSDEFAGDFEVVVIAMGNHPNHDPMAQVYSRFGRTPP